MTTPSFVEIAHNEGWDSALSNFRGENIASQVEVSLLIILNEDTSMQPPVSGSPSSPDTLASDHIALLST